MHAIYLKQTHAYASDKNKKVRSAYARIKIQNTYFEVHTSLNESQQKPKPRRQHSTHKKKTG